MISPFPAPHGMAGQHTTLGPILRFNTTPSPSRGIGGTGTANFHGRAVTAWRVRWGNPLNGRPSIQFMARNVGHRLGGESPTTRTESGVNSPRATPSPTNPRPGRLPVTKGKKDEFNPECFPQGLPPVVGQRNGDLGSAQGPSAGPARHDQRPAGGSGPLGESAGPGRRKDQAGRIGHVGRQGDHRVTPSPSLPLLEAR